MERSSCSRAHVRRLPRYPRQRILMYSSTSGPTSRPHGAWWPRQGVWVRPPESQLPARIEAPTVSPYQPASTAEGEVFKAHQAIEETVLRHDAAAYERLTLPEFIRVGERGQMSSRSEWIKTNVVGKKVARVPLVEDVRVRIYGDVAVMTHRHIARDAEGTTTARPLRMMRAWIKRVDGWKLAATISTIVSSTQNP